MKFTNGFWVVKPEFTASYVKEIYQFEHTESSLTLYAPYKKIHSRGDTLNTGMMTITCDSPLENTLRLRLTAYAGRYDRPPECTLLQNKDCAQVQVSKESGVSRAQITSGSLSLRVTQGAPELCFYADGVPLTKTANKGISQMTHRDGSRYVCTELGLDVGELVYGLGERFTPYVKNGQVVDMWNEDGGTSSEIAYKNIPFYMTNKHYGVFVNHTGKVSFETGSEKVESVQFSVEDETLEYIIVYGKTPREIISTYTALTGRPPLLPEWSYGLWLTTSFTTDYDEKTVNSFIDGMTERNLPLSVFHFDCFWMKEFEWCNFQWDTDMFPNPEQMLEKLHNKGLKVCVWINPYIGQKSPLFAEGMKNGFLLKKPNGDVWQWDMWQAGMALVDFTNPAARQWYQIQLKALLDRGVDCFKTDFGERVPLDVRYFNDADPHKMHNYYTHLYNECVFELLKKERGEGQAVLFARSAVAGGQQYPVHWGGDSTSTYVSMAETLRGGLSLADSGFAFWSHDIGGFEDEGSADLYKRWVAFGLLSSHSRLHGSSTYRVPWNYDEEACDVLRFFSELRQKLMPYILQLADYAHKTGVPLMRPMHMEFPDDPNCAYLDRQYMFGDSLLVAPVFSETGEQSCYLPAGKWTHLLSKKEVQGGVWFTDTYDYFSLPLFVKDGAELW